MVQKNELNPSTLSTLAEPVVGQVDPPTHLSNPNSNLLTKQHNTSYKQTHLIKTSTHSATLYLRHLKPLALHRQLDALVLSLLSPHTCRPRLDPRTHSLSVTQLELNTSLCFWVYLIFSISDILSNQYHILNQMINGLKLRLNNLDST